jgi:hypothetical protein
MKRREFIARISAVASLPSLPLAVRAEQPALPVLGLLSRSTFDSLSGGLAAFRRGLAVCRSHPQWRKARRFARPAIDSVQVRHQSQNRKGARPYHSAVAARARRRVDRMSNCDFVAGRSLIALVAPRPALHAPALGAASALTRPNQSAQWGYQAVC